MDSTADEGPLLIEFIGTTGAGKSTLVAALIDVLAARGFRALEAQAAILARYRLAFARGPKVRSALVHLLAVRSFCAYTLTRPGRRLARLAVRSILRDAGNLWTAAGLLRCFVGRVGTHLLLRALQRDLPDCDFLICDEGVVHAAHNLFVHAGSPPLKEEIALFGELVPRPDLLIWVTVPTAQSAAVIRQRGHARVAPTPEAARAFAEHARMTFEALSSVPALSEITYRVDNASPAGDEAGPVIRARAALIADFLEKQHRRPPGEAPQPAALASPVNAHP